MILDDRSIENKGSKGVPHIIYQDGRSEQRLVGQWRLYKPVVHHETCSACGLCWVVCPDTAISLDESDKPVVNYALCKGCLICWQSCPGEKAIEKIRDTHREEQCNLK